MKHEKIFKNANIMQSCEDPNKLYVCIGNKRYIFEEGKYIGWYEP